MSFNIFEGARRLALLAGGVATLITVVTWYNSETFFTASYAVSQPGLPYYRIEADTCPNEGSHQNIKTTTNKGNPVWIYLCLMPMTFKDGVQRIPYKVDATGMVWGAARYSTEVEEYRKTLEKTFKIPEEHQVEISESASKARRKESTDIFGALGLGLAMFAVFVFLVGWIVRGFMGIPSGMDRRP
jgi:hypothetical protein